jgi:membrane protease YdiL (CAAX protease family)
MLTQQKRRRGILIPLSILIGYMLARLAIYLSLPAISRAEWFYRDCLMTVPRALGLVAAFIFTDTSDRHSPKTTTYVYASLLLLSTFVVVIAADWAPWPAHMVLIGLLTSLVVGFFEEYLFRGALLSGLAKSMSTRKAIMASSGVFAISHITAQPLEGLPTLFAIGIVFGNLRTHGLAIPALACLHAAIDWTYFFFDESSLTLEFTMYSVLALIISLGNAHIGREAEAATAERNGN